MKYPKHVVSIMALLCALLSQAALAHNKVVVVPMAGDDVEVPAEIIPTTPIANVDTDQSDYTIGALTVIDKITKLEWQREDDNDTKNWDEAWDYCAALNLDSHDDWRLPTITELQSIVDYGSATSPLIDQVAFTNTNSSDYWSASSRARSSSSAWVVGFSDGRVLSNGKVTNRSFRCVR